MPWLLQKSSSTKLVIHLFLISNSYKCTTQRTISVLIIATITIAISSAIISWIKKILILMTTIAVQAKRLVPPMHQNLNLNLYFYNYLKCMKI